MSAANNVIHFPIDTGDQAYIDDANSLLARDVYEQIAGHLRKALDKANRIWSKNVNPSDAFDRFRSHDAVLLHGGRGTGKSTALVNLRTYLDADQAFAEQLLILKPVDPTLLENGDDLFLNVIVAALMRERKVKEALRENADGSEAFYTELQQLGSALEGIQKIGSEYGLDKLQAFMENQELAEHVHKLFYRALQLTGKKLIVLPIDDVDTSLELAFENIEVVRKYLTSPLVVPLITGDLDLYDDVIYRQFARRLTDMGTADRRGALERARHLAEEYERKVLPQPRRIRLPALRTYLDNRNIYLVKDDERLIGLPLFKAWLGAIINDRVNGEENSLREMPLETVREFAQFVQATAHLLPHLQEFFARNDITSDGDNLDVDIKRRLFMSHGVAKAVAAFAAEFDNAYAIRRDASRTQRTAREGAYRSLRREVRAADRTPDGALQALRHQWNVELAAYARHQRNWGATYLIAQANVHLLGAEREVLEHDLFRPQRHGAKEYAHFDLRSSFAAEWREALAKSVPDQWLVRLPETALLPYPVPETGRHIARQKPGGDFALELARRLLVHWSFYSPTERGDLLLCGRVFELLVASLTCDLTRAELNRILQRPPFYSLAAFARTKTLDFETDGGEDAQSGAASTSAAVQAEDEDGFDASLADLAEQINAWRATHKPARPSASFIFVVMNKFFSQISYLNKGGDAKSAMADILNLAMQSFNLFWSTTGSFEKGAVFGLPQVIATVNMSNSAKNFENHPLYTQNIAPFLQLRDHGGYYDFGTGSYTYALESHPLRRLWQAALASSEAAAQETPNTRPPLDLSRDLRAPDEAAVQEAHDRAIDVAAKRIDRYVNEGRRELDLSLTTQAIDVAETWRLRDLLEYVERRCAADPGALALFHSLRDAVGLPKTSGRRRLQQIMLRLRG